MGPKACGCLRPKTSKRSKTPIERVKLLGAGAPSSALGNLRRPKLSCLNACARCMACGSQRYSPALFTAGLDPIRDDGIDLYGKWRTEARGLGLFPRVGTAAIEGRRGQSQKELQRLWRGQQILKGSESHVPQPVSLRGSTVAQASFRDVIPVSRQDHSAGRTRISTRRFF